MGKSLQVQWWGWEGAGRDVYVPRDALVVTV